MSTVTFSPAQGDRAFTARGDLAVAFRRIGWEVRNYARQPSVMVFTFIFPVVLMLLFSVAFGGMGEIGPPEARVTMADLYLPALLAGGVVLSGMQNLATDIATEKGDGTLRRLAATPLRPWQFFAGKFGQVLVTGLAQAILLILVASLLLRVALPTDPAKWLTGAWVFVLGLAATALLGIALSAMVKDGRAATAIVIPLLLGLQFVSGIYLPFFMLPDWLQTASGALPLRWIAQGFRAAFLPEQLAVMEQSGRWDLALVAVMLAAWLVVGLILARLTFRWIRKS